LNQKHQIEDAMEQRLGLLTKVTNKRKRKNDESSETTGGEISIAFLEAEKIKVKVRVNVNIPNVKIFKSRITAMLNDFYLCIWWYKYTNN